MKALSAWARCLRDKYAVNPMFTHVDKDMAEIGCSKEIWGDSKISLCWWHLRRAVRTRLTKVKLATTPYNVKRACAEFSFIDKEFIAPGTKVDVEDYEAGIPDNEELLPLVSDDTNQTPLGETTNSLHIRIPPRNQRPAQSTRKEGDDITTDSATTKSANKETTGVLKTLPSDMPQKIRAKNFTLRLLSTTQPRPETSTNSLHITIPQTREDDDITSDSVNKDVSEEEDDGKQHRRTFCPSLYRVPIVDMMERHYCTHPMIPGYAEPNHVAIKKWAVQKMYKFCVMHELPEVWAYLWENWYRKGRWELWARSAHSQIPVLKTTMILESQLVFQLYLIIFFPD
jgi:hypothetical protein